MKAKKTTRIGRTDFLIKLVTVYKNEADKCGEARAYLAGSIVLGTAVEAGLLAMFKLYPYQAKTSQTYQQEKSRNNKKFPYSLDLFHLNKIALELGWLTPQLGKIVDDVREIRNLVHPGKHVLTKKGVRISKRHYESSYKKAERVFTYLVTQL